VGGGVLRALNSDARLILSDMHMLGLDGMTPARRIRAMGYLMPILLMSGETMPSVDLVGVNVAGRRRRWTT
jgi:CheY-like chemotaxis protein